MLDNNKITGVAENGSYLVSFGVAADTMVLSMIVMAPALIVAFFVPGLIWLQLLLGQWSYLAKWRKMDRGSQGNIDSKKSFGVLFGASVLGVFWSFSFVLGASRGIGPFSIALSIVVPVLFLAFGGGKHEIGFELPDLGGISRAGIFSFVFSFVVCSIYFQRQIG